MAQLTITVHDSSGAAVVGAYCVATLCDSNYMPVNGHDGSGYIIRPVSGVSNASGVVVLDLVANSTITPANTYYSVKCGNGDPVLVLKTGSTQTLQAAIAVAPAALGLAAGLDNLVDVDLSDVVSGNHVLTYDAVAAQWKTKPLPGPGTPRLVGDPMRSARAAWANGLLTWLHLGDSNSVGYYATSFSTRWITYAVKFVQTAFGHSPDQGQVNRHSLTNYNQTWTTSGSLTEFATSGLGYAAVGPVANGGYVEYTNTINSDRFWIWYTGGNLIGRFEVKIDGGANINVPSLAPATIRGGVAWDSGPLSLANHTVRFISADAVFLARLEHIYFFRGNGNTSGAQGDLTLANSLTRTGVTFLQGMKFGTKASNFSSASATTWWTDALDKVPPRLVTVMFSANEITAGDSAASMRTAINAMVARINTVVTSIGHPIPSYLFFVYHGTGATSTTADAYARAVRDAAADCGAAVFDFREITGYVGTAAADTLGFTSSLDGSTRVHLSDLGHRALGQAVGSYIVDALGGIRQ